MAKYRPIDTRLWSDRRFLALGDDAKLLWVFLLTTPSMLPIPGVIIGGEGTLAEQLGWSTERFRERFHELLEGGMKVRAEGRVVWLSNALKYQPPHNPNTIKGWAKVWDDIPEGDLKKSIWDALKIACKSWNILFSKLFPQQFGERFAQPLLELFDKPLREPSRTGSRTETGTETRSRARSRIGEPASPSDPVRPLALTLVGDQDREQRKRELVSVIGPKHAMAFARVKQEIGSTALGPSVVDKFEQLRELLDEIPSLDGMLERCEYALAIREAEARDKRTMQFFGASMWKRQSFEKALTFELKDVDGTSPSRDVRFGRAEPATNEEHERDQAQGDAF